MKHHFNFLIDAMGREENPPRWWEETGYPRWVKYHPGETSNVYADEAVLLDIACQNCDERFLVSLTSSMASSLFESGHRKNIETLILEGLLHYGDPPNIGCCLAGATMNCLDLRIVEFWRKADFCEWQRIPELEIVLPDGNERGNIDD